MKRFIIPCVILFSCIGLYAQEPAYLIFRNSGKVYLKWENLRDVNHEYFVVYRQYEHSETWERINTKPLKIQTELNEITRIAGEYYGSIYLSIMGVKRDRRNITRADVTATFNNDDAYNMLNALSVTRPFFAELLGTTLVDSPEINTLVRYKINSVQGPREKDYITTAFINPQRDDTVPRQEKIVGIPSNNSATIQWERNLDVLKSGKAVYYNIYRAYDIAGPYQIINFSDLLQGVFTTEEIEIDTNYFNYSDFNLDNGKTYYYYLTAVNTFGYESLRSEIIEVTPNDDRQPLPPSNITIEESPQRIKISWKNASRVIPKGYEIYKSTGNNHNFKKVFPELESQMNNRFTSWIDTDISEGGVYYYYLRSVGFTGLFSDNSDTITVMIEDNTPPSPPSGIVAVGDTGAIKLTWNKNTETDLLGYQIERSSDPRFATRFLITKEIITDNYFIDSIRKESQTDVAYFVYALDKFYNRSPASEPVYARVIDILPPLAPEITTLYTENDNYIINWTKSPDSDLKHYNLYLSREDTSSFQKIIETNLSQFSGKITEQKSHFFKVNAVDSTGNSSPYSKTRRLEIEPALPLPPDSVKIEQMAKYVNITWKIPNDEHVVGYFIQRQYIGKGTPMVDVAVLKSTQTRFMDWDIDLKSPCTYFIFSRDEKWRKSKPIIIKFEPKQE